MAEIYLHLEDGTSYAGDAFGFESDADGEVVFSTGMTGYTESLTDPSFAGQILVFTYPLLGNYGVPKYQSLNTRLSANFESEKIWVKGVVVSSYSDPSHYLSDMSFSQWLSLQRVPAIANIDTRVLTQRLREKGVMRGKITRSAVKGKQTFSDIVAMVPQVSCGTRLTYRPATHENGKHVVVMDCGIKHGILRELLQRGYLVTRIPWNADPLEIPDIDGVICSNGPGDPKDCKVTIENIARVVKKGVPFLGICLGHQLLALAIGADTYKLPYGHRGLNQPCQDVSTLQAYVTSQNHGYAVKKDTIPAGFSEWFVNLNDGTNEGIKHEHKPFRSVQFHPEGHPGPSDTSWIFSLL